MVADRVGERQAVFEVWPQDLILFQCPRAGVRRKLREAGWFVVAGGHGLSRRGVRFPTVIARRVQNSSAKKCKIAMSAECKIVLTITITASQLTQSSYPREVGRAPEVIHVKLVARVT